MCSVCSCCTQRTLLRTSRTRTPASEREIGGMAMPAYERKRDCPQCAESHALPNGLDLADPLDHGQAGDSVARVDRDRALAADRGRERRIERVPAPAFARHRLALVAALQPSPALGRLGVPVRAGALAGDQRRLLSLHAIDDVRALGSAHAEARGGGAL